MTQKPRKIAVVGLGYVGLPIAVAFGQQQDVIGFDINPQRIKQLNSGIDKTGEVNHAELSACQIQFTHEPDDLIAADFYIVTVPTPITRNNQPDLSPLHKASELIGQYLRRNDIVVYESTVYPGVTEESCVPILEQYSKLKHLKDFFVAYSPERINPADKSHRLTQITKVVAGDCAQTLAIVTAVYQQIISAGVHQAPSIKVAEAAKVIENTQRDLNIALMNELAIIFDRLNIDTQAVLKAAQTKWNFLPFKPGLVGGHCIGVDPYYLTYKAQQIGYHPEVILAGRRINDSMGHYIAQQTIKQMIQHGLAIKHARVGILGLAFKENCPDLRNSKVVDIYNELQSFSITPLVHDPLVDKQEALATHHIELCDSDDMKQMDALILAVAHDEYCKKQPDHFIKMLANRGHISDVKGIMNFTEHKTNPISYWRL